MKKIKYFLFSLLCMICSCVVFAKDEISIEKMIPVYDENSGVIVSEDSGVHSVVFNDKDQNVKYNIVLKNNTKRDISLGDIVLPESPEEFFKYELVGLDENAVLEANSTEEVVLSLETVKTEGWGRNFTLDLTGKVEVLGNVVNPNTAVKEIMVVLTFTTFVTGILVITVKNRKVSKYVALIVVFGSLGSVTNAKDSIILPIKLNVSFESQNVMKATTCSWGYDDWMNPILENCGYFWDYRGAIKNIFIQNNIFEIEDYFHKFDMSINDDGKVVAYLVESVEDYDFYDLYLQADGLIYLNENASYYFANMYYLHQIHNIVGLDTSNVTDMSYMFSNTGYYAENFLLDLSSFDTSNVTNMESMFSGVGYSNHSFVLDLSNFDTSSVTDMSSMFSSVGVYNDSIKLDLSNFDTSNVTDMSGMFFAFGEYANSLNLDLSNFDTSKVIDMSSMFYRTGSFSQNFSLDISNWDTSKVLDMSYMFNSTGSFNENFSLNLSGLDTSSVTNMSYMFASFGYDVYDLKLDLSSFDTSKVTDMSFMFYQTGFRSYNLNIDFKSFNTSNVIDMSNMFYRTGYYAKNIVLDLSGFDTSSVVNMNSMFSHLGYNSSNVLLDLSDFDTSKVTDMRYMFQAVAYSDLNFDLNITHFDISNVIDMFAMFNCAGFNSEKFDVAITINCPYVEDYRSIFSNVAMKGSSKITVNYTSETEALVDQMIATKSSNSNVVKGVQVD